MRCFINNSDNSLIQKVKKTVSEYNMVQNKDCVLVGVSGGADSVTLIHILNEIASLFSLKLGIAHLNHSLRGKESDNDASFVGSLSEELHLPCFIEKKDLTKYKIENGLSVEEAGRRMRYDFFEDIAKKEGFNKVALGHTANDNAELVLMYMIRGSGPLGISGIPPLRGGLKNNLLIIRPLIKTLRSEIEDYLSGKCLSHVIDQSNMDEKYLRNSIRHTLIPYLRDKYNPKIVETLNRLASIVRSENEWIENELAAVIKKIVRQEEANRIVFSISDIKNLHPAVKNRIIRIAISKVKGDLRRIGFEHIELVSAQLESDSDKWSLDLPDRIRVARIGERLHISKEKSALRSLSPEHGNNEQSVYNYLINKPECMIAKKEGFKIILSEIKDNSFENIFKSKQGIAFFDMDKICFPLVLRNYMRGDRFTPLGMSGSQKVARYLINKKVTAERRLKIPVMLSNNKIIWLAGHIIDDSVKVTPNTRKILKAELFLA
ncbi:MAG: tRNA lysidine(34) synthetase TilS [Proteobacteria bacterium]|nr:tRNA lysidine(34) synthetase TilS [Pseudomonadota bacterium]MBU4009809.1 tRNA lysidine(34) synthetase TilS [Pseudomonadota bacterium]